MMVFYPVPRSILSVKDLNRAGMKSAEQTTDRETNTATFTGVYPSGVETCFSLSLDQLELLDWRNRTYTAVDYDHLTVQLQRVAPDFPDWLARLSFRCEPVISEAERPPGRTQPREAEDELLDALSRMKDYDCIWAEVVQFVARYRHEDIQSVFLEINGHKLWLWNSELNPNAREHMMLGLDSMKEEMRSSILADIEEKLNSYGYTIRKIEER